jgi:hypothetical protein
LVVPRLGDKGKVIDWHRLHQEVRDLIVERYGESGCERTVDAIAALYAPALAALREERDTKLQILPCTECGGRLVEGRCECADQHVTHLQEEIAALREENARRADVIVQMTETLAEQGARLAEQARALAGKDEALRALYGTARIGREGART